MSRRPPTEQEREEARQLIIQDAQRHPWLYASDWTWARWLSEGTVLMLLSRADQAEREGMSIGWVTAQRMAARVLESRRAERERYDQASAEYLEAERVLQEKRIARDAAYTQLVQKPEGGLR
jgi:hypothetical protein